MRDLILYSKDRTWLVGIIVFLVSMILLSILFGAAVCSDGWASPSIGRRGACSSHGGVDRTLGVVKLLLSLGATCWAVIAYSSKRDKWLARARETNEVSTVAATNNSDAILKTAQPPATPQPIQPPPPRERQPKQSSKVKCPICGGSMSLRTARVGKNAGGKFWGCKRFPRCKGTKTHYPDFCQ